MILRGQIYGQNVEELDTILTSVVAILEDGQDTVKDHGGWDPICLQLVAVVDEVLQDCNE